MSEVLLLIDPQEDFCEGGTLAVTGGIGGRASMDNVASFIKKRPQLDDIIVTLDCHYDLHIAHPSWFIDEAGNNPSPFTSYQLVEGEIVGGTLDASGFHPDRKYRCANPVFTNWTNHYLKELLNGGRYPHMTWPEHCIIGSPGGCIVPPVLEAIRDWERRNQAFAPRISKGSDIDTEHFGALRAEVPTKSPATQVNTEFLSLLSDDAIHTIYGAGLALSHCLANTARDTADEFDGDTFCKKFVLLEDCTASVAGLEFLGDQFVSDFKARGMRVAKSTDF